MKLIKMMISKIIAQATEWIEEYDGAVKIIYSGHPEDESNSHLLL